MKTRIRKKGPKKYYKLYMCGDCRRTTKKAKVLWEQYVSETCVFLKTECPRTNCRSTRTHLLHEKEYKKHIINGSYFKNTPQ